jgi:hypothetical protein
MTAKAVRPRCFCPICDWEGWVWGPTESRPGRYVRKSCQRCGSYPRDRLVWLILNARADELGLRLKVIEVGEPGRAYLWKKRVFDYCNVEVDGSTSWFADVYLSQLDNITWRGEFDAVLLSYVLSVIASRKERVRLMMQLHSLTKDSARLLLFDDFAMQSQHHQRLSSELFFHELRLGRPVVEEINEAGWQPNVVREWSDDRILSSVEMPFVLASKR